LFREASAQSLEIVVLRINLWLALEDFLWRMVGNRKLSGTFIITVADSNGTSVVTKKE
jgi:hypothetical protein